MKKYILAGLIITLNATSALAEIRPILGASFNLFSINSNGLSASDPTINFSSRSDETRDSGSTAGVTGGLFVNDSGKINLSYISGEESDSELLTATVTTLSYDHSFNGSGAHRGWFLGGGISNVKVESKKTSDLSSGSDNATSFMLRGGYGYLFDSNLFVETGINLHFAKVDLEFNGTGSNSSLEFKTEVDVSDLYISLSYAF